MYIVLYNPAPRSGWQAQRRIELPLGLLCSATPLDRQGCRVKIVEGFGNRHWKRQLHEALTERPICFGVTSMTGPQILHALEGCRLVRQRHPDVPIVWGGIHASLLPEQTLENPYVDIVVVGEGEVTFPELVEAIERGGSLADVRGIAYRENGQYRFTGGRPFVDLDRQPPLSYHLVDMDHYHRHLFGIDHISFNSSRGCTFGCTFCWDPVVHRRRFRAMRPETVLGYMQRLIRDHSVRGFWFTDDNFFVDLKRARDILHEVVRAGLNISIAKLHVRADAVCQMDAGFLDLMTRAGVRTLTMGVESGSPRLLELVNKQVTSEQVLEANQRLRRQGITPSYTFMMGLPDETPEEFGQTVRLALRLTDENPDAKWSFNIYTPYPGTQLYNLLVTRYGFKAPGRLEDWGQFGYRNVLAESPWIPPETKRLIMALDFPLTCNARAKAFASYKKVNPIAAGLTKLYHPLARYRVRHLCGRWPIETKIVRALGLFGRKD